MLSFQRCVFFLCLLDACSLYSAELRDTGDRVSNETEVWELLENDTRGDTDRLFTGKLPTSDPSLTGPLFTEHLPLSTERSGTGGPFHTEQSGTGGPLPTERSYTEGLLPTKQSDTGGLLPSERPVTGGPLPTERSGTAGPLPTEGSGTGGPLPTVQSGTGGPLPTERSDTEGLLPTERSDTEGLLPTEQSGTAGPLPTEGSGPARPLPTEHSGSEDPLIGGLATKKPSFTEQPGTLLYITPITVTTTQPVTQEVTLSEGAVTGSEPSVLAKDSESLDTGQTRSIPFLAISVSSLCVCDLLVAQCDVNCCCDADCSATDFSVFSECSVSVVTGDSQLCTQEAVLYSINSSKVPQRAIDVVELVNPNVFCVQKTNYQPALSYITPDEPTQENFDSLLRVFGGNQFHTGSGTANTAGSAEGRNSTQYKYGTPILTPNSYLKLPAPMGTKVCTDNNPIGFLSTQDVTCTRILQLENCSVPALTLGTYTGIQILPVPNSQQGMNVTAQAVMMQSIDGALVRGNFGNSAPFYNATTGICSNVVLGGSYSISYTDQGRITRILASFILGEINTNTIQQTFHIHFIEEGTASVPLSGNPGYVFGMPLVAGFKLPQSGIIHSTNRFGQLTLLKSSSHQSCLAGEGMRTAVLFGSNMMSGCKLQLNYTGTEFCQLAAEATLNALKGQQFPEYVAQFGNSQPENVLDWVPISTVSPTEQAIIQDMCKIPVSLELEVRWTKFGTLINPQAQIVNVTERITHAFIPNRLNSRQTVQISSSVTFLDASRAASPGYKAQPTIDAKLPFDFFHPFV